MTRVLLLLLAALAVSACADVPTGPDRSNQYDPAFEGSRLVSTPGTPTLAATSGLQLALTWADSSSFEAGYRVERAQIGVYGYDPPFETVGVTGENVTTFAQSEPVTIAGYRYRVVGMAGGRDRESKPSLPIHVRVPATTGRGFDVEVAQTASRDGQTLYGIRSGNSDALLAVDVRTGRRRWEVAKPTALLRQVPDGQLVAVVESSFAGTLRVMVISAEGSVLREIALGEGTDCRLSGVDDAVTRVLGTCRVGFEDATPAVWTLSDGRKASLPQLRGGRSVGLSPDGETAILQRGSLVEAVRISDQRTLWSVPGQGSGAPRFSADGSLVSLPYGGYDDRLFRTATGQPEPAMRGASFDETGRYLYTLTGVRDGSSTVLVTIFRVGDPTPVRSFVVPGDDYSTRAVTVLPDGGLTVAYGSSVTRWESGSQWKVVE